MGNFLMAGPLIGLFVALVGVVTFRRKTPIAIELAVWIGLIGVCVLAITSSGNPQAHELTTAIIWAGSQMVGTIVDVFRLSALRWMFGARFTIANAVVVLFAVDLLVVALVSTKRQADAWIPVTKLREWMVLPSLNPTRPELAPLSAVDEINRRFNAWSSAAAAATVTRLKAHAATKSAAGGLMVVDINQMAVPMEATKAKVRRRLAS